MDLGSYYDKISNIRERILFRQQKQNGYASKYVPQHQEQKTYSRVYNYENERQFQGLRQRENNKIVVDRVRQLDNVNQRIKQVLKSHPKKPSQSNKYEYRQLDKSYQKYGSTNSKYLIESKLIQKQNAFGCQDKKFYNQKQPIRQYSFSYDKQQKGKLQKIQSKINLVMQRDTFKKFSHKKSIIDDYQPQKQASYVKHTNNRQAKIKRKQQAQKLIQKIVQQIRQDIELRQLKQQFHSFKNINKLAQLHKQIAKNTQMSKQQLKNQVSISPQQFNPFAEIKTLTQFDYGQFASKILQNKQTWIKLKQLVSILALQQQKWGIRQIDVQNKGYISIQDFVCWLNVNSDNNFRNRDVMSFFKRIKGVYTQKCNKLQYETFLNYLTY